MKVALASSVILAGAGLAAANNNAVEEPTRNVLPNLRFGHAVPPKAMATPAHDMSRMILITSTTYTTTPKMGTHGCGGGRFRAKAIQLANVFRKVIGLKELPESSSHGHHLHRPHPPQFAKAGEMVHALPMPFIGAGTPTHDFINLEGIPINHRYHHQSFNSRLNRALMSLAPWEGGAVAFVLGCGIGVLLRMLFVLLIVAFRGIKSCGSTEPEYNRIDAEELVLPPPQYTEEKVQVQDEQIHDNLRSLSVV